MMMIKHAYTIEDARNDVRQLRDEGYGFDAIRVFLNDLARGKDITWDEHKTIMAEIFSGKFDGHDRIYAGFGC